MARIRTLPQAFKEIKETDPGTSITLNALRQWVKLGKLPHVTAGKTNLIDLDVLYEIIKGGEKGGN
jgi:hypothetical protein